MTNQEYNTRINEIAENLREGEPLDLIQKNEAKILYDTSFEESVNVGYIRIQFSEGEQLIFDDRPQNEVLQHKNELRIIHSIATSEVFVRIDLSTNRTAQIYWRLLRDQIASMVVRGLDYDSSKFQNIRKKWLN